MGFTTAGRTFDSLLVGLQQPLALVQRLHSDEKCHPLERLQLRLIGYNNEGMIQKEKDKVAALTNQIVSRMTTISDDPWHL